MLVRSAQTLTIEAKVKSGQSVSSIAREFGVSRAWVQQIKRRIVGDYEATIATPVVREASASGSSMKTLTITITPAVHDALVEACAVANRKAPEEPISILEYVEECIVCHVVELGLLRKDKRRVKAERVR